MKKSPKWKRVIKNTAITVAILLLASGLCFVLQKFSETDTHVPLIFVLAVMFVSRFTEGYLYGIIASFLAVIGVNYAFTYPYFRFDFTLTGYPLTFFVMMAVAFLVSTLTTQNKKQRQIRLEMEREKMRSNLLRAVSHDIRTPLTSIVGSASALIEQDNLLDQSQKRELLSDIQSEAQWLKRIVENILSITRISGEEAKINKQPELLEEVVSSAVIKFGKYNPGVKIVVKLPEEPVMVMMDAILIEQVLMNLFNNAVEHGLTTTVITITAKIEENTVHCHITDNGIGISKEILPKLFSDSLLPVNEKYADSKRNMHIGLSVCMSIIRAHQGTMQAQNISEGGAQISFTLPLEKIEEYL